MEILFLISLINSIRTTQLINSDVLTNIAQERAEYLCNNEFSHENWDKYGRNFWYRGENIAKGFNNNINLIHKAFINSPKHRKVILNENYQYIGIGRACDITVEEFGGDYKLSIN